MMKILWILAAIGLGLAGCAVVPVVEPVPVYVAPRPPAVIVQPHRHYHGYRHRYWR